MKRRAIVLAIIVGSLWLAVPVVEAPVPPTPPKEKCFWGEFDTLNAYHEVRGPARAYIEMQGSKVIVLEDCRGA